MSRPPPPRSAASRDALVHPNGNPVTPDQLAILNQFKQDLQSAPEGYYNPERHTDYVLLRFLRARRFDPIKAKIMFDTCEQWRRDFHTDTLNETFDFPENDQVLQIYPRFYHKLDKKGRPIYVEQLHSFDTNKLFTVTTHDRMIKLFVREYEKLIQYRFAACSIKAGRNIDQGCTIIDLRGVPISQFNSVRKIIQQVSKIASDYYPECMGNLFIINAPTLFTAIWSVVKSMLDENTVAKISVLGSNYLPRLLEVIDVENLPQEYGGTCRCPGGCSKADLGPWKDGSVPGYPKPEWEKW